MNPEARLSQSPRKRLAEFAQSIAAIALSIVAFIPLVATLLFCAFIVVVLCLRRGPRPEHGKYLSG